MAFPQCSETAYIIDDLGYLSEEIRQLSPLLQAVPAHDRPGGDHFSILEYIRFIDFIQQKAVIPVAEQVVYSSEQELARLAVPWNSECLRKQFILERVSVETEKENGAEVYLSEMITRRQYLVKILCTIAENLGGSGLPQQLRVFLKNLIQQERRLLREAAEQILAINREEA